MHIMRDNILENWREKLQMNDKDGDDSSGELTS